MIDYYFNVGNTWDNALLDGVIALNRKHRKARVVELYGSIQDLLLSVRPKYRLPIRDRIFVSEYVRKAKDHGIDINYTFNVSCVGTPDMFHHHQHIVQEDVDWLADIGVKRITVYSPLLVKALDWPTNIEISTIHNNCDLNYILGLSQLHNKIDKICLPIYMNRDFMQLDAVRRASNINLELIVNEFCVSYANTCIYRQECYTTQSHGGNSEQLYGNYPVGQCMAWRYLHPAAWIKAPAIYPQYLGLYKQRGFQNFKLTGRTHTTESVLKVLAWYMSRKFEGSVEELWGLPLDAATHHAQNTRPELYNIPVESLVEQRFVEFFIDEPSCSRKECGGRCSYCDNIFNKVAIKKGS